MTNRVLTTIALATLAVFAAGSAAAPRTTAALERLKSLEGTWTGPAVWVKAGKKDGVEFTLAYKVTSDGTAVIETMMPGTPGEMVTVYHVEDGRLALVHYCTAGNQPRMTLESSSDPDDLSFRCRGGTNMTERDSHMHSARIRIVDANHIKGAWSSVKAGRVEWTAEADLTRRP
jgi:hypothetical protein